jgi:chitinase
VALGDFDGDGKLDLAVSNPDVDQVSILLSSPSPTLAVSDATVVEGNGGTRNLVFTVALTPATAAAVTVAYATADGSATAGIDYGSVSGTLTFPPGTSSLMVSVPVFGDRDFETDETFFLNLTNPTAAEIGRGQGVGTIRNDETGYALSVSDASASEGGAATFTVSMPEASPQTVTVDYATADGTAVAGLDYTATSGTLTFAPGQTSRTVTVALLQDSLDEADETFLLQLRGAVNALITDADGQATILDDDPEPGLSVDDATVAEGNSLRTVELTVSLSAPSGREVSVQYATADGTARAGTDYLPASGTLVFSPGLTARKVTVTIVGDHAAEPSETFRVDLSELRNATLADGEAVVTIADDDTLAKAEITSPPPGSQLSSSTVTFTWTAGSGALQYWLSVGTTPGGTQVYDASQGTSLQGTVSGIPTDGSTVHVRLWSLLGTEWGVNDYWYVAAGGTVPTLSTLSIAGAAVTEGNAGTTNATFTVTLTPASSVTVTVEYATSDGTAAAGSDYMAGSGTLTFAPQVTTQTLTVAVHGDAVSEPDETFAVTLTNPVEAVIASAGRQAVGTILDDDSKSTAGFYTVTPCRAVDTRGPEGPLGGPALVAGADRTFTIAGTCDIPTTALAVSVNVTVAGASAPGDLGLHSAGIPRPDVPTVYYDRGVAQANNAIVSLSELGEMAVHCSQVAGTVDFILDVNGYFLGERRTAGGDRGPARSRGPAP